MTRQAQRLSLGNILSIFPATSYVVAQETCDADNEILCALHSDADLAGKLLGSEEAIDDDVDSRGADSAKRSHIGTGRNCRSHARRCRRLSKSAITEMLSDSEEQLQESLAFVDDRMSFMLMGRPPVSVADRLALPVPFDATGPHVKR
ncbi:hypothetical protein LK533_16475 [Sphingomonas sp. PL-96]|uniref:hypothetical protein n=1 Tax=Sphingomonas sp. PL-96 TaxID=2887201 RepID=UPI001E54135F|nr:hypothetical protein [Sphingomonas sp. PL-96]MCC2978249.1 hypothetical protein [Sphingomonas sp. PL-96]